MSSSQVYCATCGAANPPGAAACFLCGQSLLAPGATMGAGGALTGLLAPNTLLKQRYRLIAQVGKGGFAAVYQAEDTRLGDRLVAVKEMSHSGLRPKELQEATDAFRREALLLAGLAHPNLPRIYDHFSEDGRWYLVMDFIQGETLEEALSKAPGGRLPLARVLKIGLQLCVVLDYLHTRQPPIIFRDLKPSNVLLAADDTLYLVDFGIARHFKPGQAKDTVAFGSPGYAAPEQYGKAQTTPRSDIYGLGALLHQMLSGHDPSESPFRFPPLQEPDLAKIGALIAQMVQLDADLRPASMAAVRQELERLAAETANSQHSSGQIVVPGPPQAPAAAPRASVVLPRSAHAPGLSAAYARSVLPTYKGHTGRVNALAWSPDGTRIVSGSADKAVRVWDVATGKTLWTYRASLKRVLAVAWSPDGGRIAVGGGSLLSSWWRNAALVLDAGTGKTVLKYSAHTGWVRAVAWSPDGTSVASVGGMLSRSGDIVEVWNAASGSTIATYTRHGNKIDALAWSPDGTRIASGGSDATVQVWDAATAQPLLTCRVYGWVARFRTWLQVRAIAWSPDGTRIASAGGQTVQVWEADAQKPAGTRSWVHFGIRAVRIWENDQPLLVYHGHRQKVLAVAWSPDALHLASGSDDGTVHVWDASTGKLIFSYGGHTGPVSAVAWSPDGRWIASGGADATVQVWDAR